MLCLPSIRDTPSFYVGKSRITTMNSVEYMKLPTCQKCWLQSALARPHGAALAASSASMAKYRSFVAQMLASLAVFLTCYSSTFPLTIRPESGTNGAILLPTTSNSTPDAATFLQIAAQGLSVARTIYPNVQVAAIVGNPTNPEAGSLSAANYTQVTVVMYNVDVSLPRQITISNLGPAQPNHWLTPVVTERSFDPRRDWFIIPNVLQDLSWALGKVQNHGYRGPFKSVVVFRPMDFAYNRQLYSFEYVNTDPIVALFVDTSNGRVIPGPKPTAPDNGTAVDALVDIYFNVPTVVDTPDQLY